MQLAKAPPCASAAPSSTAPLTIGPARERRQRHRRVDRAVLVVDRPVAGRCRRSSPAPGRRDRSSGWQPLHGAVIARGSRTSPARSALASMRLDHGRSSAARSVGKAGLVAHRKAAFTSRPRPTTDPAIGRARATRKPPWVRMPARVSGSVTLPKPSASARPAGVGDAVERRQRRVDERRLRGQQVGDLAVPERVLQEQVGLVLHRVAQTVVPGREDVGVDDDGLDGRDGEVAEHRGVQVGCAPPASPGCRSTWAATWAGGRQHVVRGGRQQHRVGRPVGQEVRRSRSPARRATAAPRRVARGAELGAVQELRRVEQRVHAELRRLLGGHADLGRVLEVGVELVERRGLVGGQRAPPGGRRQRAQPGLRAGVQRRAGVGAAW